jgi:hypothetical protein
VELLLSQCQLDDDSPLTREWAMWAVRNMSIHNPDVQERIKVRCRLGSRRLPPGSRRVLGVCCTCQLPR